MSSAAEKTLEYIIGYMKTEGLGIGSSLPGELDLSERIGVGRSSVREALTTLKTLGIVSSRRKGGIRVLRDVGLLDLRGYFQESYDDSRIIKEAMEFRCVLEWGLAEIIFRRATAESLTSLKKTVEEVSKGRSNFPNLDQADISFHTELIKNSDNRLALILSQLYIPIFAYQKSKYPGEGYPEDVVQNWLDDHRSLLEALEKHDKKQFLALMHQHTYQYVKED